MPHSPFRMPSARRNAGVTVPDAEESASLTLDDRQALDALVDSWGPLTHEQRERLRPVLSGGITAPSPAVAA